MSLDVYLYRDFNLLGIAADIVEETGRGGISEQLRQLQEDLENATGSLFEENITHNLGKMAREAGIYAAIWRPDENGYKHAKDIIEVVEKGLADLKARPDHYKQFNATNGWGLYKHFVPFVENYLKACKAYPGATIHVSR